MIVVSAGMQKSGSAYIYNIINDLLASCGHQDARLIKEKYALTPIMRWHNNNVKSLENRVLLEFFRISLKEGKFVFKTHCEPTPLLNLMLRMKLAKVVYIYRDPRDVLLSAIDHGKKLIEDGKNVSFAQMVEFEDALSNVKSWIEVFKKYHANRRVLCIRYEQLMSEPEICIDRLSNYLNINPSKEVVQSVLYKYHKDNPEADMTGLHFNKAIVKRYETDLSDEQHTRFKSELANEIRLMGYEI